MWAGFASSANRVALMAGGLAIYFATSATVLPPPPVDASMVERTVAGAEWLAARAKETGERAGQAKDAGDLIDWLLAVGGGGRKSETAFATYLAEVGYSEPQFAVQVWLEEFMNVLTAEQAARRSAELRAVPEIQAEINTLPRVPLDDAGVAERARLLVELTLAATPESEREAAAAVIERLDSLRRIAGFGGDR